MYRLKIFFIVIIILIIFNSCKTTEVNIKINYLFIEKNKKIEKVVNTLIKSIKDKNKKDFIDLFSDEFRTAHNSSLMLKLKKDDLKKYLNIKSDMNDPVSIFFGLLFDNDFANKEYMRDAYSKLGFNLTVYNLPYETQAENPPAFYIMIYWDKIDFTTIDLAFSKDFKIISMFSFQDYSTREMINSKKKYNFFVGDNDVVVFKDKNLKEKYKIVGRNTEVKYIKTLQDDAVPVNFRGFEIESNILEINLIGDKDIPLYILDCYLIFVEDYFENLKNWKNWIDYEDFY